MSRGHDPGDQQNPYCSSSVFESWNDFCDRYLFDDPHSIASDGADSDWEGAGRIAQRVSEKRRGVKGLSEILSARRKRLQAAIDTSAKNLRDRAQQTRDGFHVRRRKLTVELEAHSSAMLRKLTSAKARRSRHKLTFTLVLCDIVLTAFILGREPQNLYLWHTAKTFGLLGIRTINYRWRQMHFYLLDFCYWPNMALLAYCWLLPWCTELLLASLGCCGLLLLSAVFFRNSYIFHSIDRVTCVYSHVSPPLTAWTLCWIPRAQNELVWALQPSLGWLPSLARTQIVQPSNITAWTVLGPAVVLYVCWACTYYPVQWVLLRDMIERENYITLFKQMEKNYRAGLLSYGMQDHAKIIYIVFHATLFSIGLVWGCVLSSVAQACVLAFVVWCCFYNGANYYIEHFWKVYEQLYAEAAEVKPVEGDADMDGDADTEE